MFHISGGGHGEKGTFSGFIAESGAPFIVNDLAIETHRAGNLSKWIEHKKSEATSAYASFSARKKRGIFVWL